MAKNPEIPKVLFGLLVSLAGTVMLILPLFIEMGDAGFALMFVSFGLIIPAGLIIAILYGLRALTFSRIVSGKDSIAHWTYTREEWKKYAEEEYKRESGDKMALFYLLVVVSIIVGAGALVILEDKEAAVLSLVPIALVIIFIRILIHLTTKRTYSQNKSTIGEVYVGKNGAYINKTLHTWNSPSRLDSVTVKQNQRIIEIEYSSLAKNGRNYATARIPIPSGKEKEAEDVARKLKN